MSKPKRSEPNLSMIVMTSLPGLGVLIEADRWLNPLNIAQRCLEGKGPVLSFMRYLALDSGRPGEILYISTEEEKGQPSGT